LRSFAIWTEAYNQFSASSVDASWAYEQNNVGASLYTQNGFEGVFVIYESQNRYSIIDGALSDKGISSYSNVDVSDIVTRAKAAATRNRGINEIIVFRGRPAILNASAVLPAESKIADVVDSAPTMIFIDTLTPEKLTKLGRDFGLKNLETVKSANQHGVKLSSTGFSLTWVEPTPGEDLLKAVLPFIGVAAAIITILTTMLARLTIIHASEMDKSYASLSQSKMALEDSEERFRAIAESASDWIWEIDSNQKFTYLSARFYAITGYPQELFLGKSITELMTGESTDLSSWLKGLKLVETEAKTLRCTYRDLLGQNRVCRLSASPMNNSTADGGFRGTASDITDEVEAHARVQHLSQHDALTNLTNRNGLELYIKEKIEKDVHNFSLMLIDLDHFKPINDSLGHPAGDAVLVEIARRLCDSVREGDLVVRLGGDEFLLILNGLIDRERIDAFCARLINATSVDIPFHEHLLSVGASIGVATSTDYGRDVTNLMRLADVALYKAKADGRNTWRYFSGELSSQIEENQSFEIDLRQAISKQQLVLHYQPRYSTESSVIASVEALVRWLHPSKGLIGPDEFIPIAERSDIIVKLGRWVLMTACETAVKWPNDFAISVNISPAQFTKSDIVNDVREALKKSGLQAYRLELEITESVMLSDVEGALTIMRSLKELGVKLNMDDFGTGYSSLGYLRTYPFDSIKIDKRFTASLSKGESDRTIVQAIIHLGRAMGMSVTAEGVETEDQLQLLREDQCNEVQGFLFSKPVTSDELIKIFQAQDARRISA
jgi:diguanylate cyclase (GGDEF)-like protein/PAS domain S-box-containing protein